VKIVVAPLAARDLQEAYDFIALDNRDAADKVFADIAETFGTLASGIVTGREVTLRTGEKLHAWSHPPYRIYYRISGDELQVVRVYHQARRSIEK
jgi:plasmid stabilization system protein ParE